MYGAKKLSPKQRTHFCLRQSRYKLSACALSTKAAPTLTREIFHFSFIYHCRPVKLCPLSLSLNNVNNATSKKVLAHCRRLAAAASAAAASKRSLSIDTSDEVESDHEELEEFYNSSESLGDEDIPMMQVDHEISSDAFMDSISISDDHPLLVWKDRAGSTLSRVYTGNSQTTLRRKEVKSASAINLWRIFPKSQRFLHVQRQAFKRALD